MITQNQLPEGWFLADAEEARRLHVELQRELPSGHLLKNVPVAVVAHRDCATDDILCQHQLDDTRFTVIHLTWRMKEEIDSRFPMIETDGDFQSFLDYEAKFGMR